MSEQQNPSPFPAVGAQADSRRPAPFPAASAAASPTDPPAPAAAAPRLGPDPRDLYLLIVGIAIGVLLGPGVLGRVAPGTYDRLFIGSGPDLARLADYDRTSADQFQRLQASGATPAALEEHQKQAAIGRFALEVPVLTARQQHQALMRGRRTAVLLALALLMVLEALLHPHRTTGLAALRPRLATARYALLAIYLALLLAEPSTLPNVPMLFVLLLLAAALVLVCIPLPARRRT